jgi:nicotinamide-nucleotide amidase
MLKSKIISIGDEILLGQIQNTNSSFIAEQLYRQGISVQKIITIGDNEDDLIRELNDSQKNFDITIITGGLGPTHDDITKPVLVKYFKDKLIRNQAVLKNVKNIFRRRNLKMSGVNLFQADFPAKAKVLFNNLGTAPGIWYDVKNKIVAALPGVPYEMKEQIVSQVIPMILKKFKNKIKKIIGSRTYLTFGITESALFEKIGDIKSILKYDDCKLAFLPSYSGVRLRLDITAPDKKEYINKLKSIEKGLLKKIKPFLIGTDEKNLENIVSGKLINSGLTLAVAESCTGGLLSSRLTDVSGSSKYFLGGFCTYSNLAKEKFLNVKKKTLEKYGAVSSQVCESMAKGIREKFNSDIGISVTGIAGPKGGTKLKPVGTVWIGYSDRNKTYSRLFRFGNNRNLNKERSVYSALNILRQELENY